MPLVGETGGQKPEGEVGANPVPPPPAATHIASGSSTSPTVVRQVDLTGQGVGMTSAPVYGKVAGVASTRKTIAYALVALLIVVALTPFVALGAKLIPVSDLDTVMKIVFAPVVGLVGSVVGFYFGSQTAQDEKPGDTNRRP
jgi:hypothetical protein